MSAFRERAQILSSLLAKSDKLNLSAMAEPVDSSSASNPKAKRQGTAAGSGDFPSM